jgi:hypothetical protein
MHSSTARFPRLLDAQCVDFTFCPSSYDDNLVNTV